MLRRLVQDMRIHPDFAGQVFTYQGTGTFICMEQ
jgi:hypothetical protein